MAREPNIASIDLARKIEETKYDILDLRAQEGTDEIEVATLTAQLDKLRSEYSSINGGAEYRLRM